jgi:cytochrome c peroxidase
LAGQLAKKPLKKYMAPSLPRVVGVAIILVLIGSAALAEDWLPPGSTTDLTKDRPSELLKEGTVQNEQALYGRLLFRSPEILGEKAVRIGLSCDSCHTNGHVNTSFYIDGLSDRPGRIDVSHRFWQAGFEDGEDNPIDIPSLRGVADTAPYGTTIVFQDLPAFTRHVTVTEFGGPEPQQDQLDALVSYMNALEMDGTEKKKKDIELSYFPLLERPIQEGDKERTLELVDLIRADLGRHLTEENQEQSRREVQSLKMIKQALIKNQFDQALAIYRQPRG